VSRSLPDVFGRGLVGNSTPATSLRVYDWHTWLPTNPSLFIRDRRRSLAAVFLWAFGAASRILAGDPLLLSLKWTASAGVS
jgi:hypothetical protein